MRRLLALSMAFALLFSLTVAPFASARPATETTPRAGVVLKPGAHPMVYPGPALDDTAGSIAPLATVFSNGMETWPGAWSLDPGLTAGWGQSTSRYSEGTHSAYCVGSSIAAPGPYVNDMFAWMVAGPFDLSTYDAATLTFDMWVDTEINVDLLYVGVSADGSLFNTYYSSGDSSGWVTGNALNLADYWGDGTLDFTGDSSVWIAFIFESDYSLTYEGAYVDNVVVTAGTASANTAPVATADSYSTDVDTPLTIAAPGVLANDDDADGDTLTASKVSDPPNGSVTLNANGGFTYTPDPGFEGTDTFTYHAYDGIAYSNTVDVDIDVSGGIGPLPPILYVSGADRFATAVEASKLAYPDGAGSVVIATGRNWPDALGGSALAGVLDGPILLTDPNTLPPVALAEIQRLNATHAVILGGTGAVSTAVENALKAELGSGAGVVERIAGSDRYDTANKTAARVKSELGAAYDGMAFVATGGNFPDALAAAPIAAANGWPLFLSAPATGISNATHGAMSGVTDVVILGGTSAVSTSVENNLGSWGYNTQRIAGTSRYDTAAKVASFGVTDCGLMWNRVGVATGENYPDALAGGVLQGKVGSVMLLTYTSRLCNEAGYALLACRNDVTTVTFFGGTGAVSQATRTDVVAALDGTWTPDEPPPTGTNGVWHGMINGTSVEAVTFYVNNNTITSSGSPLTNGASMIVTYYYDGMTMTTFVYENIPITSGHFTYTWGTTTATGGQKHVDGTISSATHASGTASHIEHSFMLDAEMNFNWTADR